MTDNDIIKALECCKDEMTASECIEANCPFERGWKCALYAVEEDDSDIDVLHQKALDIITRQKAEIERLQIESASKERAYNDEYLSRKYWKHKARDARAEERKEFAERLYKECNFADCTSNPGKNEMARAHNEGVNDERKRIKNIVDNLVKEMERERE